MISAWKTLALGSLLFVGFTIHLGIAQDANSTTTTTTTTTGAPDADKATTPSAGGTNEPTGNTTGPAANGTAPTGNTTSKNVDYCDPSLCTKGLKHVACNASLEYQHKCSLDAEVIQVTDRLKVFITREFNEMRNKAAMGGFNGLGPAARMGTLTWDSELAHLAEYNVRKCILEHDKCRNTKTHKHVGQLVGYRGLRGNIPILEDILSDIVIAWEETSSHSSMLDVIKNKDFIDNHIGPKYNYLQMVLEDAKQLGCAILHEIRNGWFQTFFTCNFGNAPTVGAPVYEVSNMAASSCKSGPNKKYTNLCSEAEDYSPQEGASDVVSKGNETSDNPTPNLQRTLHKKPPLKKNDIGIQRRSRIQPRDGDTPATGNATSITTGNATSTTTTAAGASPGEATTAGEASAAGATGAAAEQTTPAGAATGNGTKFFDIVELNEPHLDKAKLKKKFAQFVKLIKRAKLKRSKQKIVVITSNHEVIDNTHQASQSYLSDNGFVGMSRSGIMARTMSHSIRRMARSPRRRRARTSYSSPKWVAVD